MKKIVPPAEWDTTDLGMSNFDHQIDEGFEAALRAGKVGRHAGWNFNSKVWYDDGLFHAQVWVYHTPREILSAPTLEELMEETNTRYGTE